MKKYYFLIATTALLLGAGCSGSGAYTEEEKKTQDSSDKIRQADGFEALEAAEANDKDSSAAKESKPEDKKN